MIKFQTEQLLLPELKRKQCLIMNSLKKQLLVVEDSEDLRELILRMLVLENYDIFVAKNGDEALQIVKLNKLDLILLDIMMPGKSGMEVLEEIRASKDSKIKDLPIVMVTARSSIEDVDAALFAGANSYIVKPFRAAALKSKIQNILEGSGN